jgi:hypothetical protein
MCTEFETSMTRPGWGAFLASVTTTDVEGGKPKCGGRAIHACGSSVIQVTTPNAMAPQLMDLKAQTVIEVVGIVRVGPQRGGGSPERQDGPSCHHILVSS